MPCSTTNTPWLPWRGPCTGALPSWLPFSKPPSLLLPMLACRLAASLCRPKDLLLRCQSFWSGVGRQITSPVQVGAHICAADRTFVDRFPGAGSPDAELARSTCATKMSQMDNQHLPAVYMISWPACSTRSNSSSGTLAKKGSECRICRVGCGSL